MADKTGLGRQKNAAKNNAHVATHCQASHQIFTIRSSLTDNRIFSCRSFNRIVRYSGISKDFFSCRDLETRERRIATFFTLDGLPVRVCKSSSTKLSFIIRSFVLTVSFDPTGCLSSMENGKQDSARGSISRELGKLTNFPFRLRYKL